MPRPRFYRLEAERRAAILDAAAAEFGERGFEAASYNRIIDQAGLSKGAMYYYFDDKQDLYITVLGDAIECLLDAMDPPTHFEGPADFWARMQAMYGAGLGFLVGNPRAAALARSFVSAPRGAELMPQVAALTERAQRWMQGLVAAGQRVGAVRTDIDGELLAMAAFSLGEAMNNRALDQCRAWGANATDGTGAPEGWIDQTSALLIDLVRRFAQPG